MRLYEHEGKQVLAREHISTPVQYGVIGSPKELEEMDLSFPLVLKALVLVGGRGKAGGIQRAENLEEAVQKAEELLGLKIKGYPVKNLLVEGAVEERGACYLGVTSDLATFKLTLLASASGGVEIEEMAKKNPQAILRESLWGGESEKDLARELAQRMASQLSEELKAGPKLAESLSDVMAKLYDIYEKYDCKLVEINPLLLTDQGPVAVDIKIVLDDNGLYRQGELLESLGIHEARHDVAEATSREKRARKAGFPYVDLLPENTQKDSPKDPHKLYVGLVPGGAGYGIFSIDEVANIGKRFFDDRVVPVNFMDSGGGPSKSKVAEMFHLLMDCPRVDLIITSRFGGISSCHTFIQGLVQCLRDRYDRGLPMVAVSGRMVGTQLPEARAFLEKAQRETPLPLGDLDIVVGNQKIMADVIKEAIQKAFHNKEKSSE